MWSCGLRAIFPDVLLHMAHNDQQTCPFLTDAGCSVYPDRPDACRTFPVEQGSLYDAKRRQTRMTHFFRPPDFCQGQYEDRQWTPDTWAQDQQAPGLSPHDPAMGGTAGSVPAGSMAR